MGSPVGSGHEARDLVAWLLIHGDVAGFLAEVQRLLLPGGVAVVRRTTRLGATEKRTAAVRPSMRSSRSRPTARPMTTPSWSMLVSAILGRAASRMLS